MCDIKIRHKNMYKITHSAEKYLWEKCQWESINVNILIHNYIIYFKTQPILQFN